MLRKKYLIPPLMPERTVFKISGSSIKPTEQRDNFLNTQKAAEGNPTK